MWKGILLVFVLRAWAPDGVIPVLALWEDGERLSVPLPAEYVREGDKGWIEIDGQRAAISVDRGNHLSRYTNDLFRGPEPVVVIRGNSGDLQFGVMEGMVYRISREGGELKVAEGDEAMVSVPGATRRRKVMPVEDVIPRFRLTPTEGTSKISSKVIPAILPNGVPVEVRTFLRDPKTFGMFAVAYDGRPGVSEKSSFLIPIEDLRPIASPREFETILASYGSTPGMPKEPFKKYRAASETMEGQAICRAIRKALTFTASGRAMSGP